MEPKFTLRYQAPKGYSKPRPVSELFKLEKTTEYHMLMEIVCEYFPKIASTVVKIVNEGHITKTSAMVIKEFRFKCKTVYDSSYAISSQQFPVPLDFSITSMSRQILKSEIIIEENISNLDSNNSSVKKNQSERSSEENGNVSLPIEPFPEPLDLSTKSCLHQSEIVPLNQNEVQAEVKLDNDIALDEAKPNLQNVLPVNKKEISSDAFLHTLSSANSTEDKSIVLEQSPEIPIHAPSTGASPQSRNTICRKVENEETNFENYKLDNKVLENDRDLSSHNIPSVIAANLHSINRSKVLVSSKERYKVKQSASADAEDENEKKTSLSGVTIEIKNPPSNSSNSQIMEDDSQKSLSEIIYKINRREIFKRRVRRQRLLWAKILKLCSLQKLKVSSTSFKLFKNKSSRQARTRSKLRQPKKKRNISIQTDLKDFSSIPQNLRPGSVHNFSSNIDEPHISDPLRNSSMLNKEETWERLQQVQNSPLNLNMYDNLLLKGLFPFSGPEPALTSEEIEKIRKLYLSLCANNILMKHKATTLKWVSALNKNENPAPTANILSKTPRMENLFAANKKTIRKKRIHRIKNDLDFQNGHTLLTDDLMNQRPVNAPEGLGDYYQKNKINNRSRSIIRKKNRIPRIAFSKNAYELQTTSSCLVPLNRDVSRCETETTPSTPTIWSSDVSSRATPSGNNQDSQKILASNEVSVIKTNSKGPIESTSITQPVDIIGSIINPPVQNKNHSNFDEKNAEAFKANNKSNFVDEETFLPSYSRKMLKNPLPIQTPTYEPNYNFPNHITNVTIPIQLNKVRADEIKLKKVPTNGKIVRDPRQKFAAVLQENTQENSLELQNVSQIQARKDDLQKNTILVKQILREANIPNARTVDPPIEEKSNEDNQKVYDFSDSPPPRQVSLRSFRKAKRAEQFMDSEMAKNSMGIKMRIFKSDCKHKAELL